MHEFNERRLHENVCLVGLRREATTVGFLQLYVELKGAGLLDDDALARIKDTIAGELALSRPRTMSKEDFDRWVHDRLDGLSAGQMSAPQSPRQAAEL